MREHCEATGWRLWSEVFCGLARGLLTTTLARSVSRQQASDAQMVLVMVVKMVIEASQVLVMVKMLVMVMMTRLPVMVPWWLVLEMVVQGLVVMVERGLMVIFGRVMVARNGWLPVMGEWLADWL